MAFDKNLKQMYDYVLGVDVSKASLEACLSSRTDEGRVKIVRSRKFANDASGIRSLLSWLGQGVRSDTVCVVMEATGVYHELLADRVYAAGIPLCVELPNKIKKYAESLNVKTKTDSVDARVIAGYGLSRELTLYEPMTPVYAELRSLCRELMSLKQDNVMNKNRRSAYESGTLAARTTMSRNRKLIAFMEKQMETIREEIIECAKRDAEFYSRVQKVATIKGVSEISVIIVLCETNGFRLSGSAKSAVSYAGLDVIEYQSGTVRKNARISKRGNGRIRAALYMPAMSMATRGTIDTMGDLYRRVIGRNPGAKKKGIVAVERKLFVLIYTLWKKNEEFDPNYSWTSCQGTK